MEQQAKHQGRRRRGFSLALVLLVASVAMVAGMAMAVLAQLSLHFSSRMLFTRQAELMTRSVVNQLCWELDERVWYREEFKDSYPHIADYWYTPDCLKLRLTAPIFPDGGAHLLNERQRTVSPFHITFDQGPDFFSVDNLIHDAHVTGYQGSRVPPFSASLVVSYCSDGWNGPRPRAGTPRRFEFIFSRVWPYAAYSIYGQQVINEESRVWGSLYNQTGPITVGDARSGSSSTQGAPVSTEVLGDACVARRHEDGSIVINAGGRLFGRRRYDVPVPKGPSTDDNDPRSLLNFRITTPQGESYVPVDASGRFVDPPGHKLNPVAFDKGITKENLLKLFRGEEVEKWEGEDKDDKGKKGEDLSDIEWFLARANLYRLPDQMGRDGGPIRTEQDLAPLIHPYNDIYARVRTPGKETLILGSLISLSGGNYTCDSITNRFTLHKPSGARIDFVTAGGIILKDAMLLVSGDLDVTSLAGDNSTIYCTDNLFLSGGSLDAKDRGMLIVANDVRMETYGDFRGVIAAKQNLMMKRKRDQDVRLRLFGSLIAGGQTKTGHVAPGESLRVSGSDLLYNPRFAKVLHSYGMTRIRLFREVP